MCCAPYTAGGPEQRFSNLETLDPVYMRDTLSVCLAHRVSVVYGKALPRMATKQKTAPTKNTAPKVDWDERGVRVTSMELLFSAKADPSRWRKLVRDLGLLPDHTTAEASSGFAASFTALPNQLGPGSLYLTGDVYPSRDKPETAHWSLVWRLAPTASPPANLKKLSNKVGGISGVLAKLIEQWPAASHDVKAAATMTYELNEKRYKKMPGKIRAHMRPSKTRSVTDQEYTLEPYLTMTMWNITPRIGPLAGLGIILGSPKLSIIASGDVALTLTPNLHKAADDELWGSLRLLLPDAK